MRDSGCFACQLRRLGACWKGWFNDWVLQVKARVVGGARSGLDGFVWDRLKRLDLS